MRGSVGSTVATAFPVVLQRTVGTTERRRAQAQQTFQQERVPDAQRERPGKRADVHTQQPVRRHERQPCHSATRRLAYTGSARSPSGLAAAPLSCAVCVVTAPPPGVTLCCKADGSEYPS